MSLRDSAGDFPDVAKVQTILDQRVRRGSAGVIVGAVEPGGATRIVHAGSAGEGVRPLGAETIFETGSITKVFTTILLAEMAERGELSLSDPVRLHLPAEIELPTRAGAEITLIDLATHHSGLPRLPTNLPRTNLSDPYAGYSPAEMFDYLRGCRLKRGIGSGYEYSNLGMMLLGEVLSRIGGQSYEALLRERVLDPLGMTSTAVTHGSGMLERAAVGHDSRGRSVPYWDMSLLPGAGGIRSSTADMLRFLQANLTVDASPLGCATSATHDARMPTGGTFDPIVGLGWHSTVGTAGTVTWHNGATGGFTSFIGFDRERQYGVVVLSNCTIAVDDIGMHLLGQATIGAPSVAQLFRIVFSRLRWH